MNHSNKKDQAGFEISEVFRFTDAVDYAGGGIVSRQVIKKEHGNVTLFAFDKGEGLSEHTSPYDALIQVIEGDARITIGGEEFSLTAGDSIIMPADVPHAVFAPQKFKMVLTMIR